MKKQLIITNRLKNDDYNDEFIISNVYILQ